MSIYKKLNEFSKTVGKVKKNGTNPFHKSKYATLESVMETIEQPLTDNNLGYVQIPTESGLKTVIYDLDSEDTIEGFISYVGASDMQKLGSAITYARRYALVTMFGLEQTDDDGNYASGYAPKQNQNTQSQKQYSINDIKELASVKNFDTTRIETAYKKKLEQFTLVELNKAYMTLQKQ